MSDGCGRHESTNVIDEASMISSNIVRRTVNGLLYRENNKTPQKVNGQRTHEIGEENQ
jgi:hypothetical protein